MNRDLINNMQPEAALKGALRMLGTVDTENKETQAVALGLVLLAYSRKHRVSIDSIFSVANNMLYSNEILSPSHTALQNYITYEL